MNRQPKAVMYINENAKKWLEAMKTRRYQKADGELKDLDRNDTYCALGVALKVYEEAGHKVTADEWDNGYLPKRVSDWLGLKNGTGTFRERIKGQGDIPDLNDNTSLSLRRISTLLTKNAKLIFQPMAKNLPSLAKVFSTKRTFNFEQKEHRH